MLPPLIAAAHGTRDPRGPVVVESLLDGVRARLPEVAVRGAYVDVIEPILADVLAEFDGQGVVVPMFLASGYHVRVDVPEAVAATGGRAIVTPALGPDVAVIDAVAERLASVGDLPDAVVLAAAGTANDAALAETEAAARLLADRLPRPVTNGYVTTSEPTVADAVVAARSAGASTVGIASYLLAPGLFQQRLSACGADVVAGPLGAHPRIVSLIVRRYADASGRATLL